MIDRKLAEPVHKTYSGEIKLKVAFINSYGALNQVTTGEIENPEIGKKDVLIKMKAASVNPIDWKMVQGDLKAMIKLPFPIILGSDGAGIIEGFGSDVSEFKIGDEVFFSL